VDDEFFNSLTGAVDFLLSALLDTPGLNSTEGSAGSMSEAWSKVARHPLTPPAEQHQGLQLIRDHDPSFDLQAFLLRVGEMFATYHAGIDRADLGAARRFIDEYAYAGLAASAHAHGRNAEGPRTLKIKAIRPMTAKHDGSLDMDIIRVFITAEQSCGPELLCEYWELIRKGGVQTKPGLSITKCPNCGGPVDGLDPSRCAYCDTRLADPALDWVVRKIASQ
jgi:hypothetical protein